MVYQISIHYDPESGEYTGQYLRNERETVLENTEINENNVTGFSEFTESDHPHIVVHVNEGYDESRLRDDLNELEISRDDIVETRVSTTSSETDIEEELKELTE